MFLLISDISTTGGIITTETHNIIHILFIAFLFGAFMLAGFIQFVRDRLKNAENEEAMMGIIQQEDERLASL